MLTTPPLPHGALVRDVDESLRRVWGFVGAAPVSRPPLLWRMSSRGCSSQGYFERLGSCALPSLAERFDAAQKRTSPTCRRHDASRHEEQDLNLTYCYTGRYPARQLTQEKRGREACRPGSGDDEKRAVGEESGKERRWLSSRR